MPSPKRKRHVHEPDTSSAPHSPPRGRSGTPDLISTPRRLFAGIGSPRGRIIRQFEGLQIKGENVSKIDWEKDIPHSKREVDSGEAKSKRMRQVPKKPKLKEIGDSEEEPVEVVRATPQLVLRTEATTSNASSEAQEIGQCATSKHAESTSKPEETEEDGEEEARTSKESRSRQKSSARAGAKQENLLTWQDHEITGHLKDGSDDDGEGLNGIGFIPTPALAYARTEKRRQQIQDYKNREAREARRLRGERRRGEKVSEPVVDLQTEARRVRFAEVGNR